ncbi:hypothetical protein EVAR_79139_1 [Eumeta japonica]|uniref:Uncharacterized protein n=1 Tax=Eumeta variegata TaxID=151549 RepID=A0A4C1UTP3_EUMVA|nr:hypothetical protein EVAR_79139_1 [Eumeta japonica]
MIDSEGMKGRLRRSRRTRPTPTRSRHLTSDCSGESYLPLVKSSNRRVEYTRNTPASTDISLSCQFYHPPHEPAPTRRKHENGAGRARRAWTRTGQLGRYTGRAPVSMKKENNAKKVAFPSTKHVTGPEAAAAICTRPRASRQRSVRGRDTCGRRERAPPTPAFSGLRARFSEM